MTENHTPPPMRAGDWTTYDPKALAAASEFPLALQVEISINPEDEAYVATVWPAAFAEKQDAPILGALIIHSRPGRYTNEQINEAYRAMTVMLHEPFLSDLVFHLRTAIESGEPHA